MKHSKSFTKHYKVHTEMFFKFSCQEGTFAKTLQSTHREVLWISMSRWKFCQNITKYTEIFYRFPCQGGNFAKTLQSTHRDVL